MYALLMLSIISSPLNENEGLEILQLVFDEGIIFKFWIEHNLINIDRLYFCMVS